MVHGRYLVRAAEGQPAGTLVGFHGYAETADVSLAALERIPGSHRWRIVAIEALHPFYTRDQRIVANWMTSQDRELAIADNVAYVRRVIDAVRGEFGTGSPLVFAGFSQGGAMAYRAAAHIGSAGLIVLAADVPPDVQLPGLRLPPILLGRGTRDDWYTAEKHAGDLAVLDRQGAQVESCSFDGGHEWAPAFVDAAARFLGRLAAEKAEAAEKHPSADS
jgi:predicted esterase